MRTFVIAELQEIALKVALLLNAKRGTARIFLDSKLGCLFCFLMHFYIPTMNNMDLFPGQS